MIPSICAYLTRPSCDPTANQPCEARRSAGAGCQGPPAISTVPRLRLAWLTTTRYPTSEQSAGRPPTSSTDCESSVCWNPIAGSGLQGAASCPAEQSVRRYMGFTGKGKADEEAPNATSTGEKLRRVSSTVSSTLSRLSSGPVVLASDSRKPEDGTLPVTSRQEGTW